ncbi:MAG TPA: MFS transporter [Dehalococcoidia bacterium]|nr:MFS transporter [Dehalococcoidia bacterium]
MSEAAPGPPSRDRRLRGARRALNDVGFQADRLLDETQARVFRLLWLFLPEPAVARDLRFQQLMASRFLSDAGQQSLAFGALVAVTRGGASTFEVALVGVAALVPPATLGLYGGTVADALPKRVALAGVYALQAALCFIVPTLIGTRLSDMLLLLFAVNALGQVSGPTESSVLPLVASKEELASAVSLMGLSSAAGSALGTALLAPVLVRVVGVAPVLYLAGALLLLAASRVFDLPGAAPRRKLARALPRVHVRAALAWLANHPAVGTMIVVAVLSGTANVVLQTLAPRYVQSVLHVDPADAAYVFAPSALGLVAALLSAPLLMRLRGERVVALLGLLLTSATLLLLGLVGDVAALIDPVNPLRLLGGLGLHLGERLRTAALLAVPLAFGVSLTSTSVQTYINRRVPVSFQGRTFAMQSWLKNGAAIVPLVTFGAAASQFGVEKVLLVSPLMLLAVGYTLVFVSIRLAGLTPTRHLDVMESFWWEPPPAGAGVRQGQPPPRTRGFSGS